MTPHAGTDWYLGYKTLFSSSLFFFLTVKIDTSKYNTTQWFIAFGKSEHFLLLRNITLSI